MQTLRSIDKRLEALPPTAQSALLGYLEFLEWKDKHSVGKYSTSSSNNDRDQRQAIGARLLAIRTALRQGIEEAADVAGVSPAAYERYERGIIGRWPTRKVTEYAQTWNVNFDFLLDGTGEMFREGGPPALEPTEIAAPPMRSKPKAPAPTATTKPAETNLLDFSNFRRYRRND